MSRPLSGVGGGHNDLLMLSLLIGGLYVLLQRRGRSSGFLFITATAIKLTAGLVLPFALAARGRGERAAPSRSLVIGAGLAAGSVLLLGFGFFGTGPLTVIHTLLGIQSNHWLSGSLVRSVADPPGRAFR